MPEGATVAATVVQALTRAGQSVAVAESLTGGLVASTLVDVPGASTAFRGGVVVYATELKSTLAGVPAPLLAERGPVDPDVAGALAEGVRERCGADWGLATTGVAGPAPQDGKPVGLVYIAVAGPGGTEVRRLDLGGDRVVIRVNTVTEVLRLLADRMSVSVLPSGTA